MNLVLPVQKRLAELVARLRSRLGFGLSCYGHMNLVFTVQKRLAELVARSHSRLGFGLSCHGHEPGVAGPEASC